MKISKYIIFIFGVFFLFINNINASDKIKVSFSSCVDGDTAKFILNDEEITARFLAIDTPEKKHPTIGEEPWGKEASEFTCNSLKTANKIELEYDTNSDKKDKYDRHLVWVWIDDFLLQDNIIKKGYAEVAYLYGDYKYNSLLEDHQAVAKVNKLGIWSEEPEETTNYWYIIFILLGVVVIYIFSSKKGKKKIQNKVKKIIKKEIQSRL